jgi:hypothetical protein
LLTINPNLAKQWHPTKNGSLKPNDVFPWSCMKVWWLCEKRHEWEASISTRTAGAKCPYCSGKIVCYENCLDTVNPEVSKQWDFTKNGDLTPNDVTKSSGKNVWWICEKGHEWQATIANRNNGTGCPYCKNRKLCEDNCLLTVNPNLSSKWHPTKNGELTPRDVVAVSGISAWWICENGHEWKAVIRDRNEGNGCPFCSIKPFLDVSNPEIAQQWCQAKNGNSTPKDVMSYSSEKFWWVCEKGHEWETSVSTRTKGYGCPYCTGVKATSLTCISYVSPKLAKQWHHAKNGKITPNDVSGGSGRRVWWICEKGHEWQARVYHRSEGRSCPHCYKESRIRK